MLSEKIQKLGSLSSFLNLFVGALVFFTAAAMGLVNASRFLDWMKGGIVLSSSSLPSPLSVNSSGQADSSTSGSSGQASALPERIATYNKSVGPHLSSPNGVGISRGANDGATNDGANGVIADTMTGLPGRPEDMERDAAAPPAVGIDGFLGLNGRAILDRAKR